MVKVLVHGTPVKWDRARAIFSDMLYAILYELLREGEEWIRKHVPKRTGQLQEDLLDKLYQSKVDDVKLIIELGTDIPYAEAVEDMLTSQVAHFNEWGYAYYGDYSGKILLNDPMALGQFHTLFSEHMYNRLHFWLTKMVYEYYGSNTGQLKMVKK
jgi:hypothetical protein